MGNAYLFDKGQVNFWAEELKKMQQLKKHLLLLMPVTHISPCNQQKLHRLARIASDQAKLVTQCLRELPPTPEFSKTIEFTKLVMQNEKIAVCLQILSLLGACNDASIKQENPENPTTDHLLPASHV